MRHSKSQPSKRKLSTTAIDNVVNHQVSVVTRRTRSSSNADNVYTQRSTRSAQMNAFFELPNNYGSRKTQNEFSEISPLKRSKRLSASTSSPTVAAGVDISMPLPSKRKKNISCILTSSSSNLSEKENFESFEGEPSQDHSNISKNHCSNSISQNGFVYSNENKEVNGERISDSDENISESKAKESATEQIDCSKSDGLASKNNVDKRPYSDSLVPDLHLPGRNTMKVKPETSLHFSVNRKSLLDNDFKLNGKRKRHYSENENFSTRRIRRLSERGEMASVMEFFFNHKKPESTNTSSSHKKLKLKRNFKRTLRPSTLCQSPDNRLIKPNNTIFPKQLDCNVVIKIDNNLKNTIPSCDITKSKNLNTIEKKLSKAKERNEGDEEKLSVLDVACQKFCTSQSNNLTKHGGSLDPDIYCGLKNGIASKSVVEDIMDEINDLQHTSKWRKRSLRSSGVKCQPDYYALSLNLMIHRRSKSRANCDRLNNDLQVLSDSEIDINSKRSIDSLINSPERPVDNALNSNSSNQKESKIDISTSSVQSEEIDASPKTEKNLKIKKSESCSTCSNKGKNNMKMNDTLKKETAITNSEQFEPPPLYDEEPPIGPDVYYFESDHVALKHNTDYYSMLRCASVLEAQQQQALKDLEILQQQLKEALQDPITFVDKLQKKVHLNLPRNQTVVQLPSIDWSKYTSPFGTFENVFSGEPSCRSRVPSKPLTRGKKTILHTVSLSSASQTNKKPRCETFKKSWTVEEQRKLEELLIKYPQEAVEFNRFRKIASELGNRTPLQVQSRVQKYFLKLAKAGLPILGRMPRMDRTFNCKPRSFQRHRSHHQASLSRTRISTFFSNYHIPVKMNDDDDLDIKSYHGNNDEDEDGWDALKSEQVSDEEDVPDDLRFSDEYLEILQLKRQRKQQLRMLDKDGRQLIAKHYGYQCDLCEVVPIEGVRYHCIDCPESDSIDLCQSCIKKRTKFKTDTHKSNHRLEPVYASVVDSQENAGPNNSLPYSQSPFADVDYTKVVSLDGEYNYLDPNFLPP